MIFVNSGGNIPRLLCRCDGLVLSAHLDDSWVMENIVEGIKMVLQKGLRRAMGPWRQAWRVR